MLQLFFNHFVCHISRCPCSIAYRPELLTSISFLSSGNSVSSKHQASADLGSRALDTLTIPLFIVDNNAKILQINACADEFLNRPNPALRYKNCHLLTTNAAIRHIFSNLITAATGYPAIGGGLFYQPEKWTAICNATAGSLVICA